MTNRNNTNSTLWGVSVSPFVRKAQVALDEKGISYDHKEILPKMLNDATNQETPADFLVASVLGRIPAFECGGDKMSDSSVITAFIEKKFEDTVKLYPADAAQYAKAIWFESYGDNVLGTVASKKLFIEKFIKPNVLSMDPDMDIVNNALTELPKIFQYLNQEAKKGEWLAGESFSIADIAITTHFIALKQIGIEVAEIKFPHLTRYIERVISRESFKKHL